MLNESKYKEQKEISPQIEDVIAVELDGDRKKDALEFVAYLRENKMTPRWASVNSWKVSYKNQCLCYMAIHGTAPYRRLESGEWQIVPYFHRKDEGLISDEDMKKVVLKNIKHCYGCSSCAPGHKIIIFGKQFDNVCGYWFVMKNPDNESLDCAKKLMEIRKSIIRKSNINMEIKQ